MVFLLKTKTVYVSGVITCFSFLCWEKYLLYDAKQSANIVVVQEILRTWNFPINQFGWASY